MPDLENLLTNATLFHGASSDAVARVYARLPSNGLPAGCTLGGTIRGPRCQYAETLPTTAILADKGPGPTLLAEAVIPDPCFWTPELPFLYDVQVELRVDNRIVATAQRLLGLRRLGTQGRSLFWDARRFVVRGVAASTGQSEDLSAWRETATAIVVANPDDELGSRASEQGVLLIADLSNSPEDLAARIASVARWPAVGLAILPDIAWPDRIAQIAPNMVLARCVRLEKLTEFRGSSAVICDVSSTSVSDAELASLSQLSRSIPVLLRKPITSRNLVDARAACDRLQRDFAAVGDYAGYCV